MNWWRDFGFAARSLRKNPVFAATAIITLALGIGASTAIFSVVNAVLLRPLPYDEPDRLGIITVDLRVRGVVDFPIGAGDVYDFRREATFFDGIAAVSTNRGIAFRATESDRPEPIVIAPATTNIFKVLGVSVVAGRDFTDDDGIPNQLFQLPAPGAPAVQGPPPPPPLPIVGILGYSFWQSHFGGDTSIIGRTVLIGGGRVSIVGIASPDAQLLLPPNMQVERTPDLWTALRVNFEGGSRQNVAYRLIGRLKPGVSMAAARGQITQISNELLERFPTRRTAGVTFHLEPMKQYLIAGVRPAVVALMGAVLFVLLIACANVANLLLVRASQRERELAVRAAIGGSPWSLIRQLLAESLVVASAAAVVGALLAAIGVPILLRLAPANLPRMADVSIDLTVLGFTIVASFLAALTFGLFPAVRASRPNLADVLRASGRSPSLAGAANIRNVVVVAEVALSFVLLAGSGLMIHSFVKLVQVDPGFDPSGILSFQIGNLGITSATEFDGFMRQTRERLAALPGVEGVTTVSILPFGGTQTGVRWGTHAAAADPTRFRQGAVFDVMPGYFELLKTRLIAGRTFTEADNVPTSNVVIIDAAAAQLAFGDESPIGKTILARIRTEEPETFTVVGLVAHQRHTTLVGDEKESLYFPYAAGGGNTWAVKVEGDPRRLEPTIRATVAQLRSRALITNVRSLSELVDVARAPTRFTLVLMAVFALIAAVLAAVGLYGVLSSVVRQRTAEIGIRMAFGSQASTIFGMIIGQGLRLSVIGLAIGIATALAATRAMSSMLVGVAPSDPVTFAAMTILFLLVATAACWLPARRAASLDPNVALRAE
jgi:putative ABC transport system permease protein